MSIKFNLVSMLTADYEHSCCNSKNLVLLIRIELSKNVNAFCNFFIAFRIYIKFGTFGNKN